MRSVWIVGGGGDTGARLARALAPTCDVTITSRAPDDLDGDYAGATLVRWDPGEQRFGDALAGRSPDVVVNLIGAWLVGARSALVDATDDILSALSAPARYIHCSATSVWGSRPGETVDETSPTFVDQRVAGLHLEAEGLVLEASKRGIEPVILRLPHIYGPGRERTIGLMRDGRFVIMGDGRNRMHHLHIEDLVSVLATAATLEKVPSSMYAVVDDDDGTYSDYCDFVTAATGVTPLPFMSLSDALNGRLEGILGPHFGRQEVVAEFWRFMTSDLRVDNTKMKRELGIELTYPTYRQGLPGVIDATLGTSDNGETMIPDHFTEWTSRLEQLGFEPLAEPSDLLEAESEHGRMSVTAFRSDKYRWGRVALLDSVRMQNLNVVVFPELDVDAPTLGIEIVCGPDGQLTFAAFDMWGDVSPEFGGVLEGSADGLADGRMPIEGRIAALLTERAVALKGLPVGDVLSSAWDLMKAYLDAVDEAGERETAAGRKEQTAVAAKLLNRPGGKDLLASMFGESWAERFLNDVYFPAPE